MDNKIGDKIAIPVRPKRFLILTIRRLDELKAVFFEESHFLRLYLFHHFNSPALIYVKTITPKIPPMLLTTMTFQKLNLNKITAAGIPTFPKKRAQLIITESTLKNPAID